MENHHFLAGKTHYKWPFSIAMLNYRRPRMPRPASEKNWGTQQLLEVQSGAFIYAGPKASDETKRETTPCPQALQEGDTFIIYWCLGYMIYIYIWYIYDLNNCFMLCLNHMLCIYIYILDIWIHDLHTGYMLDL